MYCKIQNRRRVVAPRFRHGFDCGGTERLFHFVPLMSKWLQLPELHSTYGEGAVDTLAPLRCRGIPVLRGHITGQVAEFLGTQHQHTVVTPCLDPGHRREHCQRGRRHAPSWRIAGAPQSSGTTCATIAPRCPWWRCASPNALPAWIDWIDPASSTQFSSAPSAASRIMSEILSPSRDQAWAKSVWWPPRIYTGLVLISLLLRFHSESAIARHSAACEGGPATEDPLPQGCGSGAYRDVFTASLRLLALPRTPGWRKRNPPKPSAAAMRFQRRHLPQRARAARTDRNAASVRAACMNKFNVPKVRVFFARISLASRRCAL